jgi:hypothetical protein
MAATLPQGVVTAMAQRDHRLYHWLFHTVRNGWRFFTDDQRTRLRAMGWEPPRPALRPANPRPQPDYANNSGEDFLYMHRQMIGQVNALLSQAGDASYPRVEGWKAVPPPNDADYPVPPAWDSGDPDLNEYLNDVKSATAYDESFRPWELQYTDKARLKTWTLGELGARIEFTIHNQMHMRWCAEPSAIRPDGELFDTVDVTWDAPAYDWLGDTYSSHVNPVFWKLHGWIDNRIEDWKAAHGVAGDIQWKGTWLGPSHHAGHGVHVDKAAPVTAAAQQVQSELESAAAVVGRGEFRHHFWSPVASPPG